MNKNSVLIKDKRVFKTKNDRLLELYDYLNLRGFNNYPDIISTSDSQIESKYIKEKEYYELIKGEELIKTVSLLHYKTLSFKEVSKNKYRDIYELISGNYLYLKKYYENIISSIEEEEYMSPSHYLFIRNYTVIDSSFNYIDNTLKKWFKKVENKSKERVCVVHNNLSLDHFIKGDKNYLISFDNYMVDTPVIDLYKFYKKEGYKLEFSSLLKVYEENIKLLDEEKMLLNILISIPPKIEFINNEFLNCKNIKANLNYIYSSLSFINSNK